MIYHDHANKDNFDWTPKTAPSVFEFACSEIALARAMQVNHPDLRWASLNDRLRSIESARLTIESAHRRVFCDPKSLPVIKNLGALSLSVESTPDALMQRRMTLQYVSVE